MEALDTTARKIADRGPDALVERLRTVYREAAQTHSDIVTMDDGRLEELVQQSVQRADGLQWRRALADVATQELGISLSEALRHPAVERAQEMLGAPSYEESLAELTNRPAPSAPTSVEPEQAPEPEPAAPRFGRRRRGAARQAEAEEADRARSEEEVEVAEAVSAEPEQELVVENDVSAVEDELPEVDTELLADADEAEADEAGITTELMTELDGEAAEAEAEAEDGIQADELRVTAVHLGGVANLPAAQSVDLRVSADGLDIMRDENQILGRLGWIDIDTLEVPVPRGRRRRRGGRPRLVVRTRQGDASFEIASIGGDELREQLEPLITRFRLR